MGEDKTRDLLDLLRVTLKQLERDSTNADEPAMWELKRRIIRTIAELRIMKNGRAARA
jgi:hypothetical protein